MPTLKVPGADLNYQTVGDGPMLLAIHGGDGSGETFGVGDREGVDDARPRQRKGLLLSASSIPLM